MKLAFEYFKLNSEIQKKRMVFTRGSQVNLLMLPKEIDNVEVYCQTSDQKAAQSKSVQVSLFSENVEQKSKTVQTQQENKL